MERAKGWPAWPSASRHTSPSWPTRRRRRRSGCCAILPRWSSSRSASKDPSDFVSQADLRAEQTLKDELNKARPGYAFLMEESGASGSDNWSWRWVVDPLDGTTQFPARHAALGDQHRPGTAPAGRFVRGRCRADLRPRRRRDVLGGERHRRLRQRAPAARLRPPRDRAKRCSPPASHSRAVSGVRRHAFSRTLATLMPQVAGIRRFGAAALDLAWVAAWPLRRLLGAGDQALGHRRRHAAGARGRRLCATDVGDGDPRETSNIVAGNPHLHAKLRACGDRGHAAAGLNQGGRRGDAAYHHPAGRYHHARRRRHRQCRQPGAAGRRRCRRRNPSGGRAGC